MLPDTVRVRLYPDLDPKQPVVVADVVGRFGNGTARATKVVVRKGEHAVYSGAELAVGTHCKVVRE